MRRGIITKLCLWSLKNHDEIASNWRIFHWLFAFMMLFFTITGKMDLVLGLSILASVCLSTNGFIYFLIKLREYYIKTVDNTRERKELHNAMIALIKKKI